MSESMKKRNAALEALQDEMQRTISEDLLSLARQHGAIVTPEMRAQATMTADLCMQALFRHVRLISVATGERPSEVLKHNQEAKAKGLPLFDEAVVPRHQAEGLANGILDNKLSQRVYARDDDMMVWTDTVMILPPVVGRDVATPEPIKPASPIIMPGSVGYGR